MRRTKEEAEQTKNDILKAAVRLFSENGIYRTSLQDIAKVANVTRGAVYWHFKNKIEIFDAIHERLHQPFVAMILEDMEKNHPEPLLQVQELCTKLLLDVEYNSEKRQALSLFLAKYNYCCDLEPYRQKHNDKKKESTKLFSRYFESARKKGMLAADADPEILARSISCYMKGIVLEHLNDPKGFKMSEYAPKMMALFINNLRAT